MIPDWIFDEFLRPRTEDERLGALIVGALFLYLFVVLGTVIFFLSRGC